MSILQMFFSGGVSRAAVSYTFASNTANASLNVTSISGYTAGTTDVTIAINAGVYLYGSGSAQKGLTLTGGSTGDTITLVNNGYIMGFGGTSGFIISPGAAVSLGFNTTINNTNASAYIGGGGGGGGYNTGGGDLTAGGGGGAGGGLGDGSQGICNVELCYSCAGGAGGGIGQAGAVGGNFNTASLQGYFLGGGGGGGRIFPGTGGSGAIYNGAGGQGGGAGGGGGRASHLGQVGVGGAGGGSNQAGGVGTASVQGGGGGGWGASGGAGSLSQAGGNAVALNGYTVTWASGQTARVYGSIS